MAVVFRGVQNGIFRTLKCTLGVLGFRGSVGGLYELRLLWHAKPDFYATEYGAELPPFISIVRYPGRPAISGMETFVPYEPLLLGAGLVFNILNVWFSAKICSLLLLPALSTVSTSSKPTRTCTAPFEVEMRQINTPKFVASHHGKTSHTLGDHFENTPPSRDKCSNTPVALCFLWYRRLSLLHPHFFP